MGSEMCIRDRSGAAYNGDMATVTFGFSAQSDEARHMTLGLEVIKFILEQHPDNLPIVQRWIDKWFWRGYRLLTLVAMMMDYMLPKRVMSWREAWEMYFEHRLGVKMANDLKGRRQLLYLWRQQDGLCPICRQKITKLTGWHSHHLVQRSHGGSDSAKNRVLLHPHCHRQVHSLGLEVTKPRPATGV